LEKHGYHTLPDADSSKQTNDSENPHHASKPQEVNIRNASEQINPTPSHEFAFTFCTAEPNYEVSEEQYTYNRIECLNNRGYFTVYWCEGIQNESEENKDRQDEQCKLKRRDFLWLGLDGFFHALWIHSFCVHRTSLVNEEGKERARPR
jgi:hypothetical protein